MLFENLLAKWPQNAPAFLSLLFNFYTKQGNGKMQNTAQKLYKTTGERKFQFWSVASMLQQESLPPMMLTIAEKHSPRSSFLLGAQGQRQRRTVQPGAEEIELYLEVLKRQDKTKEPLLRSTLARSAPRGWQE